MHQDRLFRLAHSGIHLVASHEGAGGWHLAISMRRQDELWSDVEAVHYDHLTTSELLDALCAHIGSALGM